MQLLLLLAAPTCLWGRCGRHNSPPASSVMDFIFRRSDGFHVFLAFFSQVVGTISRVFLPTYSWSRLFTWPKHPSLAFLHLSVILSTFSLALVLSFLMWSLSVWPHANMHIFIYVTSSFFTWELVTGTVSIPYSIAG